MAPDTAACSQADKHWAMVSCGSCSYRVAEQPYGPGAVCDDCGHFAERHNPEGCQFPRPADNLCRCAGMLWLGVRWPRPWLPAPEGLRA